MWKMIRLCLMWGLWRERNDKIFNDPKRTLEEPVSSLFLSLFTWIAVYLAHLVISFSNFLTLFSHVYFMCIGLRRFALFGIYNITYIYKYKISIYVCIILGEGFNKKPHAYPPALYHVWETFPIRAGQGPGKASKIIIPIPKMILHLLRFY